MATRATQGLPACVAGPSQRRSRYVIRSKQWISGTVLVLGMADGRARPAGATGPAAHARERRRVRAAGSRPASSRTSRRSSARPWSSTPRRRRRSGPSTSSTKPSWLAIGDKRYAGIKDYAANYGTLTDAKATELIDVALGLEEQRLALDQAVPRRVPEGAAGGQGRPLVPDRDGPEQDRRPAPRGRSAAG